MLISSYDVAFYVREVILKCAYFWLRLNDMFRVLKILSVCTLVHVAKLVICDTNNDVYGSIGATVYYT
jgi:hypothetical protein